MPALFRALSLFQPLLEAIGVDVGVSTQGNNNFDPSSAKTRTSFLLTVIIYVVPLLTVALLTMVIFFHDRGVLALAVFMLCVAVGLVLSPLLLRVSISLTACIILLLLTSLNLALTLCTGSPNTSLFFGLEWIIVLFAYVGGGKIWGRNSLVAALISLCTTYLISALDISNPFMITEELPQSAFFIASVCTILMLAFALHYREQLLDEATSNLHTALCDAASAERLKTTFLATISHEIKTPVHGIMGITEMLLNDINDTSQLETIRDALEADVEACRMLALHLFHLVSNVLDSVNLAQGELRLDTGMVEVPTILDGALDQLEQQITKKKTTVNTKIFIDPSLHYLIEKEDDLLDDGHMRELLSKGMYHDTDEFSHGSWINLDFLPFSGSPLRLQQCVANILSNAVKFTPENGQGRITIIAKITNISVCEASRAGEDPDALSGSHSSNVSRMHTGSRVPSYSHSQLQTMLEGDGDGDDEDNEDNEDEDNEGNRNTGHNNGKDNGGNGGNGNGHDYVNGDGSGDGSGYVDMDLPGAISSNCIDDRDVNERSVCREHPASGHSRSSEKYRMLADEDDNNNNHNNVKTGTNDASARVPSLLYPQTEAEKEKETELLDGEKEEREKRKGLAGGQGGKKEKRNSFVEKATGTSKETPVQAPLRTRKKTRTPRRVCRTMTKTMYSVQELVSILPCLASMENAAVLEISVIDNGIGFNEKDMSLMFDSFTQVDSKVARAYEGVGLGLKVTKNLVEMMDGKMTAISPPPADLVETAARIERDKKRKEKEENEEEDDHEGEEFGVDGSTSNAASRRNSQSKSGKDDHETKDDLPMDTSITIRDADEGSEKISATLTAGTNSKRNSKSTSSTISCGGGKGAAFTIYIPLTLTTEEDFADDRSMITSILSPSTNTSSIVTAAGKRIHAPIPSPLLVTSQRLHGSRGRSKRLSTAFSFQTSRKNSRSYNDASRRSSLQSCSSQETSQPHGSHAPHALPGPHGILVHKEKTSEKLEKRLKGFRSRQSSFKQHPLEEPTTEIHLSHHHSQHHASHSHADTLVEGERGVEDYGIFRLNQSIQLLRRLEHKSQMMRPTKGTGNANANQQRVSAILIQQSPMAGNRRLASPIRSKM